MTAYTEARKRGDTQGMFKAHVRARQEKTAALIRELRRAGILSARKAAAIKRAVRVG